MKDYQKYINALRKCAKEHDNDTTYTGHIVVSDLCRDTANLLESLEQEPKTGYWITWKEAGNEIPSETRFECSVCHDAAHTLCNGLDLLSSYCPNCGARMVGGAE